MDHLPCPSISHTSDVRAEWNPVVLDITDSLGGKKTGWERRIIGNTNRKCLLTISRRQGRVQGHRCMPYALGSQN